MSEKKLQATINPCSGRIVKCETHDIRSDCRINKTVEDDTLINNYDESKTEIALDKENISQKQKIFAQGFNRIPFDEKILKLFMGGR